MKNNQGITLITIIITIIVIIILAAVTIYYGLNVNIEKAGETRTTYEVYSIIDAVNNRAVLNQLNPDYYAYIGDNSFGSCEIGEEGEKKTYLSADGWYLLESVSEFSELGLDNVTGKYLVNYKKGLVFSVNGVLYSGERYYSMNELKKEMGGGQTVLSYVEYDADKKVNKPILSKGMVPVKFSGANWVVTHADDEEWYDYSSSQMAWANVMLMDELEVEGYTNEQVKKTQLSELVGKAVVNEGSSYVWIPRYTATSVGETGSKIIFSNLTEDTNNYGGETYYLPDAFTYDEGGESIKLTGIWVSKYEAGFDS